MKNNYFILMLLVLVSLRVNAQDKTLKGTVLDGDGSALAGANIIILNSTRFSNFNKNYKIRK